MKLDSNVIVQATVVVKDIKNTSKNIASLFGMEVPEIFPLSKLGKTYAEFEGIPTDAEILIANFNMGNITLELIEPDNKPSTFRAFLDEKGEGVHHIGLFVKDRKQALETMKENGIKIRYWGSYPGGTYDIADTRDFMGVLLNIKHED